MPAHNYSVFDKLMIKVQEHETTIASLTSECSNLHTAIVTAETRIRDLYEEQARMEDELADRNVVTEKLRNQIREVEKEERDLRKRYNDQVSMHFPISSFVAPLLLRRYKHSMQSVKHSTTANNI